MSNRVLPRGGPTRELLRSKGQFWTPDWITDAMTAFVAPVSNVIFDAGFGAGAFGRAAARWSDQHLRQLAYSGCETDASALEEARLLGTPEAIVQSVEIRDFFDVESLSGDASIVANPPYIRHHRLEKALKARLQRLSLKSLGKSLDGRTGLHAFFLIHALSLLGKGQRLAFIVPADICEGLYAQRLWAWIGRGFRLHAVVTFAPAATPFPGVDTNAVILLLSRDEPQATYSLVHVLQDQTPSLQKWIVNPAFRAADVQVHSLDLQPALLAGVSRVPFDFGRAEEISLGDVIYAMRGVATGANDFFCMTSREISDRGLPFDLFVRTVLRTKDVPGSRITSADLDELDAAGRPTFLLNLDDTPETRLPPAVREYLTCGVARGLPVRALIAQRRPWYKMERRRPPAFLFAYLGRRNSRFIANEAAVIPSTSFLCIYPHAALDLPQSQKLGDLLADPELFAGLANVAKSYGGGAFKVEPRSLERLPIGEPVHERHPWISAVAASHRLLLSKRAI